MHYYTFEKIDREEEIKKLIKTIIIPNKIFTFVINKNKTSVGTQHNPVSWFFWLWRD